MVIIIINMDIKNIEKYTKDYIKILGVNNIKGYNEKNITSFELGFNLAIQNITLEDLYNSIIIILKDKIQRNNDDISYNREISEEQRSDLSKDNKALYNMIKVLKDFKNN